MPRDLFQQSHPPYLNPRRDPRAWVLVGLLHLGLLLSLWKLPVWADRTVAVAPRPPLVVTLWASARPAVRPAATTAADPRPRLPARLPPPLQQEPQAITLPAEPVGPAQVLAPVTAPTSAAPPAEPPGARPPPAALNLSLPRGASAPWRQRNPALDDPRSNSAKLSLEETLANAMGGDGSWHMERLDNDRIRYRRGDECVLVTRGRAGQLELGNGAFRNAWMVGNC